LARFLAAYPDIRLDVSLDEALTNVVAQGFDAGLRLGHSTLPADNTPALPVVSA
jgi:DNA-binding transcriptional LysR family regulator